MRGPSSAPRAHLPAQLFGAVALAALLAATMAFSSRDGIPSDRVPVNAYLDAAVATPSGIASPQVPGDKFDTFRPFLVSQPPVAAPVAQAPIPTAPPVQLLIASMDVHRPVEAVGLDRHGAMKVPANWWNAGWYKGGPVPGAPGDAVIEGHAGYPDQPLIFGKLDTLRPGDRIVVVLSDGSRQLFLVASKATVPAGSAPPGMGEPYGLPRLTLITCTGHFDDKNYSYSRRLVIEARYAGLV